MILKVTFCSRRLFEVWTRFRGCFQDRRILMQNRILAFSFMGHSYFYWRFRLQNYQFILYFLHYRAFVVVSSASCRPPWFKHLKLKFDLSCVQPICDTYFSLNFICPLLRLRWFLNYNFHFLYFLLSHPFDEYAAPRVNQVHRKWVHFLSKD